MLNQNWTSLTRIIKLVYIWLGPDDHIYMYIDKHLTLNVIIDFTLSNWDSNSWKKSELAIEVFGSIIRPPIVIN